MMGGNNADSPSSSGILPLARQLRRASISSLSSLLTDKPYLNQTLDQIHTTASQSETLTTFNDYTNPPPSSATPTLSKRSQDAGTGATSWYSRVKGSVLPATSTDQRPTSNTGYSSAGVANSHQVDQASSQGPRHAPKSPASQQDKPLGISETIESQRVSSHHSNQSQATDVLSVTSPAENQSRPELVRQPSQGAVQRAPSKASSQASGTALSTSKRESRTGQDAQLVNASEVPPKSPQIVDNFNQQLQKLSAPNVTISQSPVPSESSGTKSRRSNTGGHEKDSNSLMLHGSQHSPSLPRFPSAPDVLRDREKSNEQRGSYHGRGQQSNSRPSSIEVPREDAIAVLKRLQAQGVGATASPAAQARGVGNTLTQLRNRVLSRQYWMKDENARDCFYCGDAFSMVRRKHHCRTCGQIFDAKCTTLVAGAQFGQAGTIRVCRTCEELINGLDDSSDFTDDDAASVMTSATRHRHNSRETIDTSPVRPSTPATPGARAENGSYSSRTNLNTFKPHFPGAIGRRVIDDLKRTSGQYDEDHERRLPRPGSSRSLKSSHGIRPHTSGHRRYHSRHLLQRSNRPIEEKAPFYLGPDRETTSEDRLPAFHSDNIIDPDLAPYLSDDAESDEDQQSLAEVLSGGARSSTLNHEADQEAEGLLKLPRPRGGNKGLSTRRPEIDLDAISLSSGKVHTPIRRLRRRNVSFTGSAFQSSPPKPQRLSVAAKQWSSPSLDGITVASLQDMRIQGQLVRSASMHGERAPPLELNNASVQHAKRLLRQMLEESSVPVTQSWEKALFPILLQATNDVVPEVQKGDAMNITNYVKLKKIPGGKAGDTAYVSGVVFSKNLALKSMRRSMLNPNIMIITFPLEYSRHEQHFMSLEPVIRQEREYLQNLVNRIAALNPQLLLVQRNVSGLALELLNKAKISTAYNVKRSVLEAISRCCDVRIIGSADKLAAQPDSHSACESFCMKTFLFGRRRKTYMYLSGCPKQLGCTIVLRGADVEILHKVKQVSEFMLTAIYNLRLETSLMRDEFVQLPEYDAQGTIKYDDQASASFQNKRSSSSIEETAEAVAHTASYANNESEKKPAENVEHPHRTGGEHPISPQGPLAKEQADDIPAPTFYSNLIERQRKRILSASPFVRFMQPYLLMRARQSERRLMSLKRLIDQGARDIAAFDESKPDRFTLITPEMINETVHGASRKIREILHAVHESEYDKATHIYKTQAKQWEASVAGNSDMFNPQSRQNITVLHSLICTSTNIACSGPDSFTIRFYEDRAGHDGFEADCTIGQYIEDTCYAADSPCNVNGCERRVYEHHRHYVHGDGRLEVTMDRSLPKAPGLQDMILMWRICRICNAETQPIVLSDNTWSYSFGKYLELAFWSLPMRMRADICSHDVYRDHWQYFGYKNWAIRFQYDPINLLEVIVPRTRITWKVVNDLKYKNENFRKAERRVNRFASSVKARLKSIRLDTLIPEKADECKEEIERLSKLINDDQQAVLAKLQEKYVGSKFYEIVPFNRALRMLHEKAGEWDDVFQDFEQSFFPSEKDITRLAALQIKKVFLEREDSGATLTSPDDVGGTPFTEESMNEKLADSTLDSTSSSQILSPEKVRDAMTAVVEQNVKDSQSPVEELATTNLKDEPQAGDAQPDAPGQEHSGIQHLDLAVSPAPINSESVHTDSISAEKEAVVRNVSPDAIASTDGSKDPDQVEAALADTAFPTGSEGEKGDKIDTKRKVKASAIPRYTDHIRQQKIEPVSQNQRSQSQPAHPRLKSGSQVVVISGAPTTRIAGDGQSNAPSASTSNTNSVLRRPSQLITIANARASGQSMIPRSTARQRNSNRVSALTKHFEQLSKEFEKERLKDQRKRAARYRQAAAYPAAALKPVVEVFRSVHEAVGEQAAELTGSRHSDLQAQTPSLQEGSQALQEEHETLSSDDAEPEGVSIDPIAQDNTPSSPESAAREVMSSPAEDQQNLDVDDLDLDLELPRHEKTSLMKMLTNFWAERSASGWETLYYPLREIDHVFANSDIIVREDEPSSLIALALDHDDYQTQLKSIEDMSMSKATLAKTYVEDLSLTVEEQASIERSLLQDTGHHLSYQFERGPAKMQCKVFWAEQFEAVRKKCGVAERIVESLSRCLKWDSKGGKTKSAFLKTLDDRFVLKSLSQVETRSFLRFAPFYFNLMGEALFHELPSLIAKMLGFYQVTIKNPVTGTDFDWYMLLMENLFYDRTPQHTFDLKGSMRNRRIQPSGEQNEVLLDENMVDYIAEHPIFAREHSKRLLRSSIYNDTLFLAKRNVMDYSLMLGIDDGQLVVGIIDCIRTYTWDKKLETWVKDRGKNRPTVTEPKDYKHRFREAINRYVTEAPNCWSFALTRDAGYRIMGRSETSFGAERDEDVVPAEMTADEI